MIQLFQKYAKRTYFRQALRQKKQYAAGERVDLLDEKKKTFEDSRSGFKIRF